VVVHGDESHGRIQNNDHLKKKNESKENRPAKLVGGFNPFEKYESKWVHLSQASG